MDAKTMVLVFEKEDEMFGWGKEFGVPVKGVKVTINRYLFKNECHKYIRCNECKKKGYGVCNKCKKNMMLGYYYEFKLGDPAKPPLAHLYCICVEPAFYHVKEAVGCGDKLHLVLLQMISWCPKDACMIVMPKKMFDGDIKDRRIYIENHGGYAREALTFLGLVPFIKTIEAYNALDEAKKSNDEVKEPVKEAKTIRRDEGVKDNGTLPFKKELLGTVE